MKINLNNLSKGRPWVLEAFKNYTLSRENALTKVIRFSLNSLYYLHKTRKNLSLNITKEQDIAVVGEKIRTEAGLKAKRVQAKSVSIEEFKDFRPIPNSSIKKTDHIIDVIVPVYKGYAETSRCLFSVLKAKNTVAYELVVINDNSPDEEINRLLCHLSSKKLITLINNKDNLGFVGSMNKGMSLHKDRDVIWLNSDTEVFDFWIDRLVKVATVDKTIATVTSLTNNSTISSYPKTLDDNYLPLEISDRELDELCSHFSPETFILAPTGVGCCMYVSRDALDSCGDLDEVSFGKGYGEENDLCQRFEKEGYKNVLSPTVFVRHYGAISFGAKAQKIQSENLKRLLKKYPNYSLDVQKWIMSDPLLAARVKLDSLRIKRKYQGVVLNVCHEKGGGTTKFIKELSDVQKKKGMLSLSIVPSGMDSVEIKGELDFDYFPNIKKFDLKFGRSVFHTFLLNSGIKIIHIHSLVGFPISFYSSLITLPAKNRPRIIVSIHDYHWICPKVDLMPNNDTFCDIPVKSKCISCARLYQTESPYFVEDYYEKILTIADKRIVPSKDTQRRFENYFPALNFDVVPHQKFSVEKVENAQNVGNDGVIRIGILGAVGVNKGFWVIERLAKYLKKNGINDIQLFVIGYSVNDSILKKQGVTITGGYSSFSWILDFIKKNSIDLIFLPSICPETFSYTCSEALLLGKPICSFNIGAIYERLSEMELEEYIALPYKERFNPEFIINEIRKKQKEFKPYITKEKEIRLDDYYGY